jgi:hypothetical protein
MYEKLKILYSGDASIISKEAAMAILDRFYGALTALDLTASALLLFDGILIAAAAFAADRAGVTRAERVGALFVIFIALVAAGFSLRVTHISYPFFGEVVIMPGTSYGLDFSKEFERLDYEVTLRTMLFQIAWWLSVVAVAIPMLSILGAFLAGLGGYFRKWLGRGAT